MYCNFIVHLSVLFFGFTMLLVNVGVGIGWLIWG